jgi:hypothetical protein
MPVPYLCSLNQSRLEPFKRGPLRWVLSMGVNVHRQARVRMAQDALSRLGVYFLFYDQHGCQRMPEGMEASPPRVVGINEAVLHETESARRSIRVAA